MSAATPARRSFLAAVAVAGGLGVFPLASPGYAHTVSAGDAPASIFGPIRNTR